MKVRDKLHQYDSTRPFTSWLYKVAANHCWDLLRRRKIRQDKETEDLDTLPLEHPDANQLEQLIEKRTSEEVRKALDKLPSRARMALVMRYYSDMSYDEIADELGVRRAFVGVVLLRARHELRQALESNTALAAGGASWTKYRMERCSIWTERSSCCISSGHWTGRAGWKFPRIRKNATFAVRC